MRFARSLGALAADRPRLAPLLVGSGAALAVLWLLWALRAEVGVNVRSSRATVVVERGRFDLVASVEGRVASASLELGASVGAGQVLVELEAGDLDLRAERADGRLVSAQAELERVDAEREARELALREASASATAAVAARSAGRERLDLNAQLAAEELERKQGLSASGGVSELELSVYRTRLAMARADLEVDRSESESSAAATRQQDAERGAELEALAGRREQLAGAIAQARLDRAQVEIERESRRIRAPSAGRLAEARRLPPGSWVAAGETLATVVEAGPLQVVAELPISAAAGRVRVGQQAEMELDGFAWSRFGRLPLVVARVAAEPRDGAIRVELALDGEPPAGLPLEHGLPGTVSVRVEELTPAELLIRSAGGGR
ncbi:HlyD family secretion protein [Engelhardtia mirabilis]|uniref:Multidrug resistance protein MdtN n=1 Tax=Engelhardtia mirabilis TaxID=2528011 RepID=A0A518BHL7_9BACT|nr:multidrug resistance protein MdtN [Planctomycetes bacterium Pla133]QDV00795.1 multidrug resistance protein MdtN [Planctomycetes bacterium Pla86]